MGIVFENTVSDVKPGNGGTRIGVKSIGSLMKKMGGSSQIENMNGKYRIALSFPKVSSEDKHGERIVSQG